MCECKSIIFIINKIPAFYFIFCSIFRNIPILSYNNNNSLTHNHVTFIFILFCLRYGTAENILPKFGIASQGKYLNFTEDNSEITPLSSCLVFLWSVRLAELVRNIGGKDGNPLRCLWYCRRL